MGTEMGLPYDKEWTKEGQKSYPCPSNGYDGNACHSFVFVAGMASLVKRSAEAENIEEGEYVADGPSRYVVQ
jgi:hypothetical protein